MCKKEQLTSTAKYPKGKYRQTYREVGSLWKN